jgi:hypothetical protein
MKGRLKVRNAESEPTSGASLKTGHLHCKYYYIQGRNSLSIKTSLASFLMLAKLIKAI